MTLCVLFLLSDMVSGVDCRTDTCLILQHLMASKNLQHMDNFLRIVISGYVFIYSVFQERRVKVLMSFNVPKFIADDTRHLRRCSLRLVDEIHTFFAVCKNIYLISASRACHA